MITRAIALPRATFEEVKQKLIDSNAIMISITCTEDDPVELPESDRILALQFDDIHPSSIMKVKSAYMLRALSFAQAAQVVEFLDRWQQNSEKLVLFTHCAAGICRSGAVVTYAFLTCEGMDDILFTQDNPNILPNEWVLDLLTQTRMAMED